MKLNEMVESLERHYLAEARNFENNKTHSCLRKNTIARARVNRKKINESLTEGLEDGSRLYDDLCALLTDWENPADASIQPTADDLYDMLVRVQNYFDFATERD